MYDHVLAVLTIIVALLLVILIISLSWWLMWKVFLSRFEFINEIFFPDVANEGLEKKKASTRRKVRKE